MARFEIFPDKRGKWRWHLKANNGLIIADSGQGYVTIADCKHGIELVRELALTAEVHYEEGLKQRFRLGLAETNIERDMALRKALAAVTSRRNHGVKKHNG